MRAVTVAEGGRLEVAERPQPVPAADEVLVRVLGAGLNRADILQRAGVYPAPPGAPPDIPGLEFAGVVEAVGGEVDTLRPGATVFGIVGGGAHAEYLTTKASHCARVPAGLDLVAMGGVPEAFITAHDALVTHAQLAAREWVLIHAVGSGVGTAGVQLAEAWKALTVGTARTQDKLGRCAGLGLDAGIVPPQRDDGSLDVESLAQQIIDATGGAGVDVTLELAGGPYVEVDIRAAAERGRIVLIGAVAGGQSNFPVLTVMGKRLAIFGTMLRTRTVDEKVEATRAFEADVVPLLERETVVPVVDAFIPIEDAAKAYDLVASNATFGKVILDCR